MIDKEKLKELWLEYGDRFGIQLKRSHSHIFEWLHVNFIGKTISEKAHRYIFDGNINDECHNCGNRTNFISHAKGFNQFCSLRCRSAHKSKEAHFTKTCVHCGNEFTTTKRHNRKTCSDECKSAYLQTDSVKILQQTETKKALLEKYGVEHPSKIKTHAQSVKNTKQLRWGNSNWVNSDKAKNTKFERYGDRNYNNMQAQKETMVQKYGVQNPSQLPQTKESHFQKVINRISPFVQPLFQFQDYSGVEVKRYQFRCNACHSIFEDYIDNGHMPVCKSCNPSSIQSIVEFEVIDFIKTIYDGKIVHGDREVLKPKELDIYLPELNLAIEINGLYFHSQNSGGKDKWYHLQKTEKCLEKGIRLIHIFDVEWQTKGNILRNLLKSLILKEKQKIHGRKTTVKVINYKTSAQFLNNYHLQGEHHSKIRYGLFYGDELIACMLFIKSRYDKQGYEISRWCVRPDIHIHGGFQKVLQTFIRDYSPNQIVSYCDRRFFTGGTYKKAGFHLQHASDPGYFYVKNKQLYNRIQFQKHKLPNLLEQFDSTLTEWENMQQHGWDRIWDCGNFKFVMKF